MSENPIRVLHVVTQMTRGGLETMLMNYDRHIDHNKVQFDFLEHRNAVTDYDREILELGGRIYRLPRLNPMSPKYLKALDRFFAEHPDYRIVHVHLDCMSGIPLKYAKKYSVPIRIAHAHSSNETKNAKYPLKLLHKQFVPKYATHFFACGEAAGRWMFGVHAFSILNNAVDADSFIFNDNTGKQYRNLLDIDPSTLLLGHVGRFSQEKNHGFLIDVFSELVKLHLDSKLLLVGQGDLEQTIRDKVKSLGLSGRVIFAGVRSDVNALMQAMDVFVFPSLFEGLGIVAVEAQAAGLPCVVSNRVPRECEKTDGLVTFLPLEAGAEQWAKQILSIAGTERRDTSTEIKANGFDIRENAAKLQQFYLEHWKP
jgi:glycosyltransferase involved in cell wall biosynthesis